MKAFRVSLVMIIAYLGFISLGLPDGVLGVAWPSIRKTFGLQLDALGPFFLVATAGYLFSSFNSGRAVGRLGVGRVLAFSSLTTALGLLGYALSPGWWVMVSLSLIAGLGAGAVDSALNTFVATFFTKRHVSWLHACWGVGASTGPALMTAAIGMGWSWRWGYAIILLIQLVLTAGFFSTTHLWSLPGAGASAAAEPAPVARRRDTLRLPMVWLSMGIFFVYCGVEVTVGQWMYSVMVEARGVPAVTAGVWISLYWGSLTAGRFLIGALANRIPPARLVRFSMAGAFAGMILIALRLPPACNLAGLMLTGFSLASIFPSLIATTPQRLPADHVPNTVGYQVGGASLGLAICPGCAGLWAQHVGLETIPFFVLAAILVMIALHEAIQVLARQPRKRERPPYRPA